MKVLIFSKDPALFAGGGLGDARARHVRYAAMLRARNGGAASIRIICWTPHGSPAAAESPGGGIELFPARSRCRALFLIHALLMLRVVLRGWRPDLVTAQEPWEEGLLGWLVARLAGAKFLTQIHTDISSGVWRRQRAGNGLRARIALWLARRSDGIRVVSASQKAGLAAAGITPARIYVAPVAAAVSAAACVPGVREPAVLFVGRFSPEKNLPLWIRVAAGAAEAVPSARFILVGDGGERGRAEKLIGHLGLKRRFLLPGRAECASLPAWYARARLLLLTSDYEGLPRVAIEAMQSGLPVVATACPGLEEVVTDGVTGYLCRHGDEIGLRQRVVQLLTEPETARSMGTAAYDRAREDFSAEALTRRLIECWEKTAGRVAR